VWGVSAAIVCVIGIVLPPGGQPKAYAADSSYYSSDANATSTGSSNMTGTSGTSSDTSGTSGTGSTGSMSGTTGGAAGTSGSMSGSVTGTSSMGRSMSSSSDMSSSDTMQQMDIIRASKLRDAKVIGSQNEEIGKVNDVVLSSDMSTVSYVAVQHGGMLGVGEKLYAIPWSAVSTSADGKSITVPISKQELQSSKGFDDKNWPDQGDARWSKGSTSDMSSSYGTTGTGSNPSSRDYGTSGTGSSSTDMSTSSPSQGGEMSGRSSMDTTSATGTSRYSEMDTNSSKGSKWSDTSRGSSMSAEESMKMRRLSEILKLDVKSRDNTSLGKIDDLGIDKTPGRVVYGIVSWGGITGKSNYAAVPWDMFMLQAKPHQARIDADRNMLQAVAFDMSNWKNLSDRSFASRVYQQFGEEPYSQVYGYPKSGAQVTTGESWMGESAYNKGFNPSTMTTVQGKIDSTGSFRPMSHAASGLRLKVTTNDGRTVTVHCGPKDYITQQGFSFKKGDTVTVTGSQVQMGKNEVIMATTIQSNGKTLNLRDSQGNPLWTSEDINRGMNMGTRSDSNSTGSTGTSGSTGSTGSSSGAGSSRY